VYASVGTLEALFDDHILNELTDCEVMSEEGTEAAGMYVRAFHTSHDSRESLGFRIHTADERRIAVATDMGYMTETVRNALRGCDLVQIESNHDVRMLQNGSYPYFLKRRILADTGHLSNEACAVELPALAESGVTRFVLAHLSGENNSPDLAYVTSQSSLLCAGMTENVDFQLSVAPRNASEAITVF
jgi:phosphoribosyl 1,2-cyclic phosphodiesterase